jgi:hypothetical protein
MALASGRPLVEARRRPRYFAPLTSISPESFASVSVHVHARGDSTSRRPRTRSPRRRSHHLASTTALIRDRPRHEARYRPPCLHRPSSPRSNRR